tara:strand:+ start:5402 stop:6586 length:1185 start_codon:yes stop_codon:yes gene_type:complete
MSQREIWVVGATRTAIGSFGGALKNVPVTTLASEVLKSVLARNQIAPEQVGHVVIGNVIATEPRDTYLSRLAAIEAGIPVETPAFNVNRLCGSGLQAIVSAAQSILLGDCDIAIGAGAESMSRGPYTLPHQRWGSRLGDVTTVDFMNGVLHDPMLGVHVGITAENIAKRYGISRQTQDELSLQSQQRASQAISDGRFESQITQIDVGFAGRPILFKVDEHVRRKSNMEALARLKPSFLEGGCVTAGNSSGTNDGAGAVILAEAKRAQSLGLKPLARLVAYAHAGVDPAYMGMGPVPATKLVLKRAGLSVQDLDVIEVNEAFAAQVCAVKQELNLDPAKLNPNGSAIALGHPVGASGAIITTKALYELERIRGRYALTTMCIGGGQGISAIFERL